MEPGANKGSNTPNRAGKRRPRPPDLLIKQKCEEETLKLCGFLLIQHTYEMINTNEHLCVYIKEMLHSIFFLGYIYKSRLSPGDFFKNPEFHAQLKKWFPEPFEKYNSHLPSRTPFSILLDMMEKLYDTEETLINKLQNLMNELKFPNPLHKSGNTSEHYYTLEATVICVCYSEHNPQRYYGASLSCRTGNSKRIMIDVSCLETWHKFVSHAVMSFTLAPGDTGAGDFGDSITFPESVRCQAYMRDWNKKIYIKKSPCLNCEKLFNLKDAVQEKVDHPYGNCAEAEGLSKLLKNQGIQDKWMKNRTEENLDRLKNLTKQRLTGELSKVDFHINDGTVLFYRTM